jgi:exportin-2 (importin alpha re-exporter)
MGLLGCFQKLLSSPGTEADAFNLLESLVLHVPDEALHSHMPTIFTLLLKSLQSRKTGSAHKYNRFAGHMTNFLALYVAKKSPQTFFEVVDGIQQGMGFQLLVSVWLPRLQTNQPKGVEAKVQVVGLTRLLTETPALLSDANGQQLWSNIIGNLVTLLTSASLRTDQDADADIEGQLLADMQYDSAFSGLSFAKKQVTDPFPDVSDAAAMFVQALHGLSTSHPGRLSPLIQEGLKNDPKLSTGLDSMFQKVGVRLS